MPDDRDADLIAERNEAWRRGLAQGANGADIDAAQVAALRKRVGNDRARTISLIATCIAEVTKPLLARIAALEARPTLEYCGVWGPDNLYGKGNICTHHGSAWHCNYETSGEPGKGGDDWTLMVKRGRDAK